MESPEARPHAADDLVNAQVYETAKEIDRIMHKHPVENHAAILGILQVTTQRRMHEHQQRQQKMAQDAQQKLAAQQRFGVQ